MKLLKPWSVVLGIVSGTAVLGILCFWFLTTRTSVKQFYRSRLADLQAGVEKINVIKQPSSDYKDTLDQYNVTLNRVADTCNNLNDKTEHLQKTRATGKYGSAIEQTDKLCQDLIEVSNYSLAVYQSGRDYLLLDQSFLGLAKDPRLKAKAEETLAVLIRTKQTLQKINYPEVNDPAQPELIKLLEKDQAAAETLVNSPADQVAVTAKQLNEALTNDKLNFLNARIYYWNNTVGITQLQAAVTKLKENFK